MTLTPNAALASPVGLWHTADYREFVEAQFMSTALREDLRRFRGLSWPTEFTDIDSLGEVLCGISYDYNSSRCILARLPTALAMLCIQPAGFVARLAGDSEDALDDAERMLREAIHQTKPKPQGQVVHWSLWRAHGEFGGHATVVTLPMPSWEEIAGNYTSATRAGIERLMSGFVPGHGGRLLLWTGPPGTGKTYALRALAWEWREWCSVNYVTDPEALFGGDPAYLLHIMARPLPEGKWRLLVLEDTGELLSADAKSRTGQGLSRMLNVVDGLLGQGFPTLVLVTTNEPTRILHPAISRPGRCAAHVEFGPLSEDEAQAWLSERGVEGVDPRRRTLAELYAATDDFALSEANGRAVGFVA